MKRVLYLLAVVLVILAACSKDDKTSSKIPVGRNIPMPVSVASLSGSWTLHSSYTSSGAGGSWITFKSLSSLQIQPDLRLRYDTGAILNYKISPWVVDTTILIYKEGSLDSTRCIAKVTSDTLILWNTACIEGCGDKYVRINELCNVIY